MPGAYSMKKIILLIASLISLTAIATPNPSTQPAAVTPAATTSPAAAAMPASSVAQPTAVMPTTAIAPPPSTSPTAATQPLTPAPTASINPVTPAKPLTEETMAPERTYEYTLKNGLKLIVREDHRAPVAITEVWYKVGSSYEPEGITGISHALEHMMFRGSRTCGGR